MRKNTFSALFEAIRPVQWIKNFALFAAAILNGQLTNPVIFSQSLLAFITFCCLSSSSYLINDLLDVDNDRRHPFKKYRPLARGDVSLPLATVTAIILLFLGLSISFLISNGFFILKINCLSFAKSNCF